MSKRYVILVIGFMCILLSSSAEDGELSRNWQTPSGTVIAHGTFWRVGRGVLELQVSRTKTRKQVAISKLSPEDLQYLLRDNGRVIGPTAKLLSGGCMKDADGNISPRTSKHIKFSGKVKTVISDELIILSGGGKTYAVQGMIGKAKKRKDIQLYLLPSRDVLDLPDGSKARLARAYAVLDGKHDLVKQVRADPVLFRNVLVGQSKACEAWEHTQRRLDQIKEQQARKNAVAEQQKLGTLERQRDKSVAKTAAQTEALKQKMEADIKGYTTTIKKLESSIKGWESAKKNHRHYGDRWNKLRKNIREAEAKVVDLERNIRSLKKELLEL